MERLGILGGRFDPFHMGHRAAAETARSAMGLTRVLFLPSGVPPHKPCIASKWDRYAMTLLGALKEPAFAVCPLEMEGEGPFYTVDTLSALKTAHPSAALVWIAGADAIGDLLTWKEPLRILSLCEVAVVPRDDGADRIRQVREALGEAGNRIHLLTAPRRAISSTDVRRRLAEGRSTRGLLPRAVASYIAREGLYHPGGGYGDVSDDGN